ncbi:MAG: hypothetical protein LQ350_004189 [Teloschistes chrysophthalmus]|nr:MAG: hypothetical protein LQ350_004189 [Niorma chrysophthalma]
MQNWQFHSTLRRSRQGVFSLPIKYPRQFSVSTSQSQESHHDNNPPAGHDRERDVTSRVERYFKRLDARGPPSSTRPPGPVNRPPHPGSFRSLKLDPVDARDLAAVPNPSPPPPGRSIGEGTRARRAPFDARDLGSQRPDNSPRPFRTSNFDPRPREDQGPRITPRRDASDSRFQGGTTNAVHNRTRGGPDRPRRGGPGARSGRSGAGSGGRSEAGGPRKRDRDSRARDLGGGGSGGKRRDTREKPNAEEIAYFRSREEGASYGNSMFQGGTAQYARKKRSTTYTPSIPSLETFEGQGPAIACGEWGKSETVIDTLKRVNLHQDEYDERISKLAQTWEAGEFCQFRTPQEKVDTLKTVEQNLAGQGDNAPLDENKEKERMELVDTRMKEERAKLATRLLKGEYYIGPLGKGPTAELLERYTRKNETYLPKDSLALAGKISTLLPLGQPAPSAKAATT